MPSKLHRVNLTLPPDVESVVRRLARASRKSQAGVILELVVGVLPQLVGLIDLLEAAAAAPATVQRDLAASLDRVSDLIAPLRHASEVALDDILAELDQVPDCAASASVRSFSPALPPTL